MQLPTLVAAWLPQAALLVLFGFIGLMAFRQAAVQHGYGLALLLFGIYSLLLWLVLKAF